MPPTKKATGKRPATTPVTDDGEAKRLRSVIDETVDEFICALTYELPLDPVTAEDGKIYERAAITEWLKKHKKSPLTNEEMGTKLLPAHQVKNMIEKLVRSGAISGDKAEGWQKRVKEQDELRELQQDAEGGDASAMQRLACAYIHGSHGLPVDLDAGFKWSLRGAEEEACDAMCRYQTALCYSFGMGVEKNTSLATYWMLLAADTEVGSRLGCIMATFALGCAFAPRDTQPEGLPCIESLVLLPSTSQATKWFRKALRLLRLNKSAWKPYKAKHPSLNQDVDEELLLEAWLRDHATDRATSDREEMEFNKQVYEICLAKSDESEPGCTVAEVLQALDEPYAESCAQFFDVEDQIRCAIARLVGIGHLYSPIDDDHFKATWPRPGL